MWQDSVSVGHFKCDWRRGKDERSISEQYLSSLSVFLARKKGYVCVKKRIGFGGLRRRIMCFSFLLPIPCLGFEVWKRNLFLIPFAVGA